MNERHYGALQGLDKAETTKQYGEEQVKIWRRSYATPPPPLDDAARPSSAPTRCTPTSPTSCFPASECLADVVVRMLPYWYDGIVPDLAAGKVTLVAAHGNSLRALVQHLDGLSEDEVLELNIPTGIPLVYELGPRFESSESHYLGDPEAAAPRPRRLRSRQTAKRTTSA